MRRKTTTWLLVSLVALLVALPACTCTMVGDRVEVDCFGDVMPCDNMTYSLGRDDRYWLSGYIHALVVGDYLFVGNLAEIETVDTTHITAEGDLLIECSENQTLVLTETVYNDLVINMSNAKVPASLAPTWRAFYQSQVPAFEKDAINVLYFSAQVPHTYKEGTDLEFHIHIAHPDANAGISRWYFSYSWANVDEAFPVVVATTVSVSAPGVADTHQLAIIDEVMDGTGKLLSSILVCSIQRLGNLGGDTYDNEIYLISSDFHYEVDTLGSREALVK